MKYNGRGQVKPCPYRFICVKSGCRSSPAYTGRGKVVNHSFIAIRLQVYLLYTEVALPDRGCIGRAGPAVF